MPCGGRRWSTAVGGDGLGRISAKPPAGALSRLRWYRLITFGDDKLRGGSGDDELYGDSFEGNASIFSFTAGGNDRLCGGNGNDLIIGDSQTMSAFGEDSSVIGGDDRLSGGNGNDQLFGDSDLGGAVELSSFVGGNDVLKASNGNDLLIGDSRTVSAMEDSSVTGGNDTLDGGSGNDFIVGDFQFASAVGASTVIGGNDIMTGGRGDDAFLFLTGSRMDIITDFEAGAGSDDVLDVTDYGIDGTNFESVLEEDIDGNAVLAFNADDRITLWGVDGDSLDFDDFVTI